MTAWQTRRIAKRRQ